MQALRLILAAALLLALRTDAAAENALETAEAPGALSLDGAEQTLDQTFASLPEWRKGGVRVHASPLPLDDPSFSWTAGYIWDHPLAGQAASWPPPLHDFPAWTSNGAAEASPDGDLLERLPRTLAPLRWSSGALDFVADKMPREWAETVGASDPRDYISATITSFPFAQTYGVFAMSAKLPAGKGVWPAFWLVPADGTWPPELDVVEVLGKDPSTIYTTVHTNVPKHGAYFAKATDTRLDLGAAFHEYAVDWGPERIAWYFDRKLVFSRPTPADLHKPCYIIANLAVGGPKNWGGAPDASTAFPAVMKVRYIRAWQKYADHGPSVEPPEDGK